MSLGMVLHCSQCNREVNAAGPGTSGAWRCFECNNWFCFNCAKKHFADTKVKT